MRTNLSLKQKSLSIILILLFCISKTINATHVVGGDITYTCLGGNQYQITLAFYRDCAGVQPPITATVNIRSVSCVKNLNLILTRVAGTNIDVTPACTGQVTQCANPQSLIPGIIECLYSGIITLPACSDWVISYSVPARNFVIGTIVNPGGMSMYLEAKLNNLNFPCNSSPQFTNRPIPYTCVGQTFCFNNGSSDVNGDSLYLQLITPRHSATVNVTYLAGFSATQPLTSSPLATFNPLTGDFCVSPTLLQVSVLAVLVKEFRNGVFVGSVMRDIQIRTIACNNINPSLPGINNSTNFTQNICAGVPFSFNITATDPNSQTLTLSWNSGIPAATFNPGVPGTNPTGVFSWTPTFADVSSVSHCFTVTVKDNNCPIYGSQTYAYCLKVGGVSASISSANAICTAANGSSLVNLTGGVPPVSYNWSPSGGTGASATGLLAGSYTCTVTDALGCSKNLPVTIGVTPGGTALVSSYSNVNCKGANDGAVSVSIGSGATAPISYTWSPAGGINASAINLAPATYTVLVSDANGCTSGVTQVITEPALALSISPTFTNVGCYGASTGTATASAAGGTGPYTYLWMPGAFNSAAISGLAVGTYTVTATDSKGCIAAGTATIVQPPALSITAASTDANCGLANGTATVIGTGGFAPYTWAWPNGQTASVANGLLAGSYVVSLTDLNLCSTSVPVIVSSIAAVDANIISFSNVSCHGGNSGNATVAVTGGAFPISYLWSNGQTSPTANNLIAGIYSVSATDGVGCVASASVIIAEPAPLNANAVGSNPLCFGDANGIVTSGVVGGTAPYNYFWTSPGNPVSNIVTGLGAGTYTVTVTDAKGCVNNESVTLTNPTLLSTLISKLNASCEGGCDGIASAVVNNGTPPYTYLWNNPSAQTSPIATGLCSGSYTLAVLDANGCASQAVTSITEPPLLTNVIGSAGNLTCFNVCTGFAQVTVGGGTAPYSYSWSSGANTSSTITNLCAGYFACTVTDFKGCTAVADTMITEPPELLGSVSGANITCSGTCNGTGNIVFSGGTPPYIPLWTPSMQNVFNPTNLCTGNNTAKVTDANGCFVTGSINLTESNTPIVVAITTTPSNCGQSDGAACAMASGGVAPYFYSWNDINLTEDTCINLISAGTYNVATTDDLGCTVNTVVNLNDATGPSVTISSHTDLVCYGFSNATANSTILLGVPPYNILWTPGGQTTQNPINLTGGVNTITITDAIGCIYSNSVTILEPPPIDHAILLVNNISCFGTCDGLVEIGATGGTGAFTYLWDDPGLQTSAIATGLCAGIKNVIITDISGCFVRDSIIIVEEPNALSIASSIVTNNACFGENNGSIITTVSGGMPYYTFAWTSSAGNGPAENSLAAGNDTLTVSDQNGCTVSQYWTITQPDILAANLSFTSSTCTLANGTALAVLTGGTAPYSYQWNDPLLQTSANAAGLFAATYEIVVTDFLGCTVNQTVIITDAPGPVIDSLASTAPYCSNGNNGTASVFILSGTGTAPFVFDWNPGTQVTSTATGLTQGAYSVIVTDDNACKVTGYIDINDIPLLELFVTINDSVCFGDTSQVYATASGGTPLYNYSWIGSSGANFTGAGPYMVVLSSDTVFTVSVMDNNGCSTGPLDINFYVNAPLVINASDTAICEGSDALIYVNVMGGNSSAYSYSWNNSIASSSQIVSPLTTTDYFVTISDGCSSPLIDTATVIVNPSPVGSFQALSIAGCAPFTTVFNASSDIGVWYSWNCGDGNTSDANNISNTYVNPGVYDISLIITSALGCKSYIDSVNYITVYPKPVADFVVSPVISSTFVSFLDLSAITITDWVWDFGVLISSADTSNIQNPSYQYSDAGSYGVSLIVMNQFGCWDTIIKQIDIFEEFVFFAPNSFSPDENGINDIFLPTARAYDFSSFSMMIFDRWGNRIFATEDYKLGWDGRANFGSEVVQRDVYVWKVELLDKQNRRRKFIGNVTLVN